jgi:hypothetical protein
MLQNERTSIESTKVLLGSSTMYSRRMGYVQEQHVDSVTGDRYTHTLLRQVPNVKSDDSLRAPSPQRVPRVVEPMDAVEVEVEVEVEADVGVEMEVDFESPPLSLAKSSPFCTPVKCQTSLVPTTPESAAPDSNSAPVLVTPCNNVFVAMSPATPVGPLPLGYQLILHNQFSTPQHVKLYHRIMSEQFSVGQKVDVHYGTGRSACWLPANIVSINLDGTYGVEFNNNKFGNTNGPTSKPPDALRRALALDYDNEENAEVEEALSLCGWDDDTDEEWNQQQVVVRPKVSHIYPTSQELLEILQTTGRLSVFPPRQCWYHEFMPRLRLDTDVVKVVGGSVFTGVIRQITQDPLRKECFRYYIRSRPRMLPYYEEVTEESFLADAEKGNRWATSLPVPCRLNEMTVPRKSRSSTHSDIYLQLTPHQVKKKWPPNMSRMYDLRRGLSERKNIVNRFLLRQHDSLFIAGQRNILTAFWTVIRHYTSTLATAIVPPRFGWALWVIASPGTPFHRFQIAALLLHTNNVGDDSVKQLVHELFKRTSSVTSHKFDNPMTFVEDPMGAFQFLTARAAANVESILSDTGQTAVGTETGIQKGVNYGNVKALSLIFLAKQLVVAKYCDLLSRPFSRIQHELGSTYTHGSLEPLPASIVTAVPHDVCLFPPTYDAPFLNSLHGVGVKIRHLLAEAGYGVVKVSLVARLLVLPILSLTHPCDC